MKTYTTITFILFFIACCLAQVNQKAKNQHDSRFPSKGKFSAGVLTTYSSRNPPPILLGEVTYGITDKFAIGAVGGSLGVLALYGGKLNARLYGRNNYHLNLEMMSVYYPGRNGTFLFDKTNRFVMPWMLSTAIINSEWRTPRNIRYTIGIGLTETHCVAGFKKWFNNLMSRNGNVESNISPFDILTTIKASASLPISSRVTFRPEVFANFQDLKLIRRGEHMVGFPIIATVTFVYAFEK